MAGFLTCAQKRACNNHGWARFKQKRTRYYLLGMESALCVVKSTNSLFMIVPTKHSGTPTREVSRPSYASVAFAPRRHQIAQGHTLNPDNTPSEAIFQELYTDFLHLNRMSPNCCPLLFLRDVPEQELRRPPTPSAPCMPAGSLTAVHLLPLPSMERLSERHRF
jgi:hypothetical protein